MDWFDPSSQAAATQATAFNHALKTGGRILLRSASVEPWYIAVFEKCGFTTKRVGARFPGTCIDRYVSSFVSLLTLRLGLFLANVTSVNMYASTWICTKTTELAREPSKQITGRSDAKSTATKLERSVSSTSSSSVCEDLEI